jgi:hypothetical protein
MAILCGVNGATKGKHAPVVAPVPAVKPLWARSHNIISHQVRWVFQSFLPEIYKRDSVLFATLGPQSHLCGTSAIHKNKLKLLQ